MADKFCTNCGAKLPADGKFCISCGTPVKAVQAENPPQQTTDEQVAGQRSKKPIIIAAVAIVAVVLIVVIAFVALGGNTDSDGSSNDNANAPATAASEPAIELTQTYSTKWPDYAKITYPVFSFAYPDDWEIVTQNVEAMTEEVVLRKVGTQSTITYFFSVNPVAAPRFSVNTINKVASSDFVPSMVQGTSLSGLGPFMVAELVMDDYVPTTNEVIEGFETYMVLPETALQPDHKGFESMGPYPYFDYAAAVSFSSSQVSDMDEQTQKEAIAILQSFTNDPAGAGTGSATGGTAASSYPAVGSDGYILSQTADRYYSESELSDMDPFALYLARNEIFARHGRQFNNKDLRDYFESQSWYSGTIPAEQFTDDMLNDYEKKNSSLMYEIEQRKNSPYLS